MKTDNHYKHSLFLLSFLIMNADGVLEDSEKDAIRKICRFESIPPEDLDLFLIESKRYSEKEVFDMGIDEVSLCEEEEKVRIFAWLHRISEADGKVHVKEVRFLLYSVKKAGIEFEHVMEYSRGLPSLEK